MSMVLYLAVLCLATMGTRQLRAHCSLSAQVNQVIAAAATARVVGRRLARQVVVILDIILTEGRMVWIWREERRTVGWSPLLEFFEPEACPIVVMTSWANPPSLSRT